MEKDESEESKRIVDIAIEGVAAENIQRYGAGVKEYCVAYSGIDNEAGKLLTKSLKGISEEKINPKYKSINIKQQAGFSAEVLEVADANVNNIITGSPNRKIRTDDLSPTVDPVSGKTIGGINDELFDHVELDAKGNIVPDSAAQMKFVGKDPEACFDKLMSNKYQKYHDANAKIEVPSDYYDGVLKAADRKIEKLQKSLNREEVQSDPEIKKRIKEQIQKCQKIKENLRKSSVSNEDAVFARMHPKLATGKKIVQVAHQAGMKQISYGAAIAGSISLVRNFVSVIKGDVEPEEAARAVVADMGTGAVVSYGTAFVGASIKGVMQNSPHVFIRTLSKTNIAATLVTSVTTVTKTFEKFITGKITGLQCLEELGETGTTQIASVMFSSAGALAVTQMAGKGASFVIGQILIPLPVIGGIVGSLIGYVFASSCYNIIVSALKEVKFAKEERMRIEAECAEAIKMIREYKAQLQLLISEYLTENITVFNEGFECMEKSIGTNDIDGFIAGNVGIQKQLGYKNQFSNFKEFDALMENTKESFKL